MFVYPVKAKSSSSSASPCGTGAAFSRHALRLPRHPVESIKTGPPKPCEHTRNCTPSGGLRQTRHGTRATLGTDLWAHQRDGVIMPKRWPDTGAASHRLFADFCCFYRFLEWRNYDTAILSVFSVFFPTCNIRDSSNTPRSFPYTKSREPWRHVCAPAGSAPDLFPRHGGHPPWARVPS